MAALLRVLLIERTAQVSLLLLNWEMYRTIKPVARIFPRGVHMHETNIHLSWCVVFCLTITCELPLYIVISLIIMKIFSNIITSYTHVTNSQKKKKHTIYFQSNSKLAFSILRGCFLKKNFTHCIYINLCIIVGVN